MTSRLLPEDRRDLPERAALLEFAIDQANDGIAIMEFTENPAVPVRIVYANEAVQRLSGYSLEELSQPSNPFLQIQPHNRALYEALFPKVRAGASVRFEVELGAKGRSCWMEIRWSPLRYSGDGVTHYVAVLRDISERRRAVAERDVLYRALEESADYVALCDARAPSQGGPRLLYANGALRSVLGYEADELVGISAGRLIARDNDPRVLATIDELLESSQSVEKEVRLRRRDGSSFWVELGVHPIRASELNEHWLAVARDITDRRRTSRDRGLATRAIDVLPIPVEIFAVEAQEASSIFRNRAAEQAPPLAGQEHVERARSSAAEQRSESDAAVVPLRDHNGVVDAIVVFQPPP